MKPITIEELKGARERHLGRMTPQERSQFLLEEKESIIFPSRPHEEEYHYPPLTEADIEQYVVALANSEASA